MSETESKFCKFCQTDHPLTSEFWSISKGATCLVYKRHRYREDKERILLKKKEYYAKNREKILANRPTIDSAKKAEYDREYREKNKIARAEQKRDYAKRHRAEISEKNRVYRNNRSRFDINFKLAAGLRRRLCNALYKNQKSGSAVRDLGCTIDELKRHLESKFQEGMTWRNWGVHGWHIDHVVPLISFDLTDREQLLKACHYTNLQPLWAMDNLRKGANHVHG